jgi:hypothetical protein
VAGLLNFLGGRKESDTLLQTELHIAAKPVEILGHSCGKTIRVRLSRMLVAPRAWPFQ